MDTPIHLQGTVRNVKSVKSVSMTGITELTELTLLTDVERCRGTKMRPIGEKKVFLKIRKNTIYIQL